MGPYLGHPLLSEEIKVRKGGVRTGCSFLVWCGAKVRKHPTLPTVTCSPGNWGAWGLGHWGGSHQLRLSLEAVKMCLQGEGAPEQSQGSLRPSGRQK